MLHAQAAARRPEPGGPVTAVQGARAAEELPPPGRQPPGVRGRLQHRREQLLEQRPRPLGRQLQPGGLLEHPLRLVQQVVVVRPGQPQPVALAAGPVPHQHPPRHRHPLRAQQRPPAPADVGEPPGREGQFVLGDEGAPPGRAPRGQPHPGELRGAGGGEGAGRGALQHRRHGAGGLALPPGDALVLARQHVHRAGLGQPRVQGRQRARRQHVVPVQEQQIRPRRRPHARVARTRQPLGRRRVHGRHPGVPLGVPGGDTGRR